MIDLSRNEYREDPRKSSSNIPDARVTVLLVL